MSMMERARGANTVPQEQMEQEVQKGNLVPISQAQRGR